MIRQSMVAAILAVTLGLGGIATGQVPMESKSPLWKNIEQMKITSGSRSGVFKAALPASVTSLAGKTVTLSGWIIPIEAKEPFRHYILARYSPECPFCPAPWPGYVAEVKATHDTYNTTEEVTVRGVLSVTTEGDEGLFIHLNQASLQ